MDTIEGKLIEMKQNLREKGKQPIFFIGSGLSKRYLNTPSWKELLEQIAKKASALLSLKLYQNKALKLALLI